MIVELISNFWNTIIQSLEGSPFPCPQRLVTKDGNSAHGPNQRKDAEEIQVKQNVGDGNYEEEASIEDKPRNESPA